MVLTDYDLESLEKTYFESIYYSLVENREKMIRGLASKDTIRKDWEDKFFKTSKQKQVSELAAGAERIFYSLLPSMWKPNSAPIGSDLFFESTDAFIHIDVKTATKKNTSDYKGKVTIGRNQTSYDSKQTHTGKPTAVNPNLPQYYNKDSDKEKPCLTYTIQMIHDPKSLGIIAILLVSIPNGQLYNIYGNKIVGAGKNKDLSMRYEYKNNFTFDTLPSRPHRVKFIYFSDKYYLSTKKITTCDEITAER